MVRRLALLLALLPSLAIGQEFTGPAGQYTVKAPAPVVITHGDGWVTITWGTTPTPSPPAPPAPDPKPAPAYTGRLHLSYVVPDRPTQEQAALRAALAAAKWGEANITYRSYLESEPAVKSLGLLGYGSTPPVLMIQHQANGAKATDPAPIVGFLSAPASVDEVKAFVAGLRGKP